MKYDYVTTWKKNTNLLPYFRAIPDERITCGPEQAVRALYAKERTVNLVMLTRFEYDHTTGKNHIFCKINCPINPMPVKGEFEAPSVNAVERFLRNEGWTKMDVMSKKLFE